MRRVALAVVALLVIAGPALGDDITKKKHVDQQIGSLNDTLARQQQRESALRDQVAGYTTRIRALEARVGDVSLKLGTLEEDLSLHQRRLGTLNALYRVQTDRLRYLRIQYGLAVQRLEDRFVELYESDQATTLDVVLGAQNLQDALDEVQYIKQIAAQDKRIAASVGAAKASVRASREKTRTLRSTVQGETAVIAARTSQVRAVRDELVGASNDLGAERNKTLVDLSQLTASERAEASEIDALQAASAELADKIRAAQAQRSGGTSDTPSSAGLIWPVDGPITSPFGWRWGRMHQGIDIGVPDGTPIHAAAAGTVIYCGWEEGYGNLVVLDNGGNLSTAYAHQSAIAVTCGQVVAQGDVIGYVGCTGHCTGPHLHFEVRIDGNPVDPLGYLP